MSDRDPLQQLADFRTGPVTPLPAADVRRLGDRRRARRTATTVVAGAAAVLAVAVPSALWAGRAGDDPLPPTATSTPTPSQDVISRIPAGFPLDRGAYDFGSDGRREGPGPDVTVTRPTPCGADPFAAQKAVDRLTFANIGIEFEDYRILQLYADEEAATGVMEAAALAVKDCPTETDQGMTLTWTTIPGGPDWPSLIAVQGVDGAVGGTTFQLTQVGRAILQVAWSGEGGGDVSGQTAVTRQITPEMCIFTEIGCHDTAPTADGPDIPDDFPLVLEQHAMEGDGGEFLGPGHDISPAMFRVCSDESDIFSMPYADRLASVATGPEFADRRQLTTYATAEDAIAQMETIRGWLTDCPSWGTAESVQTVHHYDADTGYQDTVTYGTTYAYGLGGELVQIVRVGRGILAIGQSAEWSADSQQSAVPEITQLTRKLLPAMCAFTAKGC